MTGTEPITDEEVARIRAAIERDAEAGAYHLNPDPAFFYGSRGHRRAMAYLEYGLHQSEGDVTLDLSRVGEIDTAGLQLLWLLRREAHASGRQLNIVAVSPAVADLLAFCRLTENFATPRATEPEVEAA